MRPEEKIEKAVCDYAHDLGMRVLKMQVPGQRGWPDRQFLMYPGVCFFIEFKTPTGVLSPHQALRISELMELGFSVFVVSKIWEGKDIIDSQVKKHGIHTTPISI